MRRPGAILRSAFARLARPDDDGRVDPPADDVPLSSSPASARAELDTPPEELVCGLLRRAGGRLRQREVAERTGWSESAVSRLLTGMEADDRVRRVKVGREKVVCLPSAMPTPPAAARDGEEDRTTASLT